MIINESKFSSDESAINSLYLYKKKKPSFIVLMICSLIIIAVSISLFIVTKDTIDLVLLMLGLILFIFSLSLLFYFPKRIYSNAKRTFSMDSSYKFEFNDDKIIFYFKMGKNVSKTEFKYQDLDARFITNDLMYIFINKNQFYPLKLKCFKTEEEKNIAISKLKIKK